MSATKLGPRMMARGANMFAEKEKATDSWAVLSRLTSYFMNEKFLLVCICLTVVLSSVCSIVAPRLQSCAIDEIAGNNEYRILLEFVSYMLVALIISAISSVIMGMLSAHLSQRVVRRLRDNLMAGIVSLPIGYIDRHSRGDLMSRMTNDVENMSMTVSQSLPSFFSGILMLLGTAAVMICLCWQLALLCLITIFMTTMVTMIIARIVRRYSRERQELLGRINGCIEENVTCYRTVVAFGSQEKQISEFENMSDKLTSAAIRTEVASSLMGPIMNFVTNLSFVIIAVFGGVFASKGIISVGLISAFIVYAKQFSRPVNEIAHIYSQLQSAMAGAERVFALLDEKMENLEVGEQLDQSSKLAISFRNINFSYVAAHPILRNFNLEIPSGQKVALVGSTGSGKTTVTNLLLRYYEPDSGEIFINNQNISGVTKSSLRDRISVVLQDVEFFEESIYENLKFANENVTDEQIKKALEISCCSELIARLPNGIDTVLTDSATCISQGEKQLLSIARAFVADPDILILDEATSNVDTITEKRIQSAMQEIMKNRTSIVIAHRLATIRDADIIVVLDHGSVVESGTHFELLMAHGKYYELYMTQFAGYST